MALVFKDRVQESTTTTGTGTVTLDGALGSFQSFSGNEWEVGIGTYTSAGTTLSRDTILESSNAGAEITLSGTSNVFCTYPAEKAVVQNETNTVDAPQISATNGIFVNNSIIGADYIIPTSYNAMSVNVTVASDVTVTVPASSKWVIL